MATIANYFEQAQLSLAAYAPGLQRGMFGAANYPAYVTALKAAGMSQKQAEVFADTYAVVDQYTDPLSGFSGTVFSKAGVNYFAIRGTEGLFTFAGAVDWLTNVADVGADGIAIGQGLALFNWLQRLYGAPGSTVAQYSYNSVFRMISGSLTTESFPIVKDVAVADAGDDILDGGQGRARQPELLRLARKTNAAYRRQADRHENENPLKEAA